MRNHFLFSILILLILTPGLATARCGDGGGIQANVLAQCDTIDQFLAALPCGITDVSDPDCSSAADGEECYFDVGHPFSPGYVLAEWLKDAKTGRVPSASVCRSAKINVQTHFCGSQRVPFFRQCPDPLSSDDDCWPYCEFQYQELADPYIEERWDDSCRSYALMPRDWRQDQIRIHASALFTVGRHFPALALGWEGQDGGRYSAHQAFLEDQLGPAMLGAVGNSPLWGDDAGWLPNEPKAFKKVGLCVDAFGSLLASPRWRTVLAGVGHFPILATDCSANLYTATGAELAGGAATLDQVIPRLEKWAAAHDHDLVCVTQEIANARREARSQRPEK